MVRLLKSLFLISFCCAFFSACTRPLSNDPSNIVIKAPAAVGKMGALASLPADRKACYAVNITGQNVDGTSASTCSPGTGSRGGYVGAGEVIRAQVSRGSARKIDLYLYLLPENDTSECPTFEKIITPKQLLSTYLVGSTTIDVVTDPTIVEITADFPGVANHLFASMALPAVCMPTPAPTRPARISAARQTVTGTGLIMRARVGTVEGSKTLTGTGYKLIVK